MYSNLPKVVYFWFLVTKVNIMKKIYILLIVLGAFSSCINNNKNSKGTENNVESSKKTESPMNVSFEKGSSNKSDGIYVAYTNDPDTLWLNYEWSNSIKTKMENLSSSYSIILLFDSKKHTPNVAVKGMNYSSKYDKYMVCGYWVYPNWETKFCYGGVKSDGNFRICY